MKEPVHLGAFYERGRGHPLACACSKCWWADWWHRQDVSAGNAVPYLIGGQPTWGERVSGFEPRRPGLLQRLHAWWTRPRHEPARRYLITERPPDPPAMQRADATRPQPTPVPSGGQRCSM